MTQDIIVVEGHYVNDFAQEVFRTVKKYENQGYDVEVQYSNRDDRFSAMVIVYNAE